MGGTAEEKQARMKEDAEDDLVAQAAATAAAQAELMNLPSLPTFGSIVKQSSSFRPHMHVQMQALSAHRIDSSYSARWAASASVTTCSLQTSFTRGAAGSGLIRSPSSTSSSSAL